MENISKLETTLVLLRKDNEILLGMKKRGFGEGRYNGIGGKIKSGETPEEAMVRESQEEIAVKPVEYIKMGKVEFLELYKGKKENVVFHLYIATKWEGEPKESDEMIPKWFSISEIPYQQMFPDDKYWLPLVLEGKKVNAFFEFDEQWSLLNYSVEEIKK